jgi:RNA polymerase sigma factor (sigma-70 family)
MTEAHDHELLAEYSRTGSEAAFAAVVARYVNLVYSAALRFTSNPHHAEEITQAVFIILARKARSLRQDTVLSGWLYQTARLTAANFVKGEIRRQRREQEAYMQTATNESEPASWGPIAPLLEEAMGHLSEADRNAIVLRYFENKTAPEIAATLEMNEAAAHKRVSRALEKLRKYFLKRGVALSAVSLAGAITANSVQSAPTGLGVTVATAAAKGGIVGGSTFTLIQGALKTMAWTKAKTVAAAAVVALLIGGASVGIVAKSKASQAKRACAGTTVMAISGTTGASFTGFYVQDGQKTVFSNTVPWSFTAVRISSFEFHKQNREDMLVVSLKYDGDGAHAKITKPLDATLLWMNGRVQNGLLTASFPR